MYIDYLLVLADIGYPTLVIRMLTERAREGCGIPMYYQSERTVSSGG